MKRLIKFLIPLLFLVACNNNSVSKYYLFETSDYVDFDDSCRVIYIKSHRQLIKDTTFYTIMKCDPEPCYRVYNALGQEFSTNNINHDYYPKLKIDTSDRSYDIIIHMHSPGDSVLVINSDIELNDLDLVRYYMPEIKKIDSIRSVFQFVDPLPMLWDYTLDDDTCGGFIYTLDLMNYDSIDFQGGERVVLEYDKYKIPIPYQIF